MNLIASMLLPAIWLMTSTPREQAAVMDFYRTAQAFSGPNSAWLLTSGGDLVRTTDAGATWSLLSGTRRYHFERLAFWDLSEGIAINGRAEVWATRDSGQNWTPLSTIGLGNNIEPLEQILLANKGRVWIVNPFSIWASENAGATWRRGRVASPVRDPTDLIAGCYFVSPLTGWARGAQSLYRTTDGGINWRDAGREVPAGVSDIFFLNEAVGWASTRPYSAVYRTDDGGESWHRQTFPAANLSISSIQFVSRDLGWAVGSAPSPGVATYEKLPGVILNTADGGRHWNIVHPEVIAGPFELIHFGNASCGWLLSNDTVYRTADGGISWREVLKHKRVRYLRD